MFLYDIRLVFSVKKSNLPAVKGKKKKRGRKEVQ
jgi:hypothetical protein